ncbi:hypothetical protein L602_001900000010, partial [Cupriavidus gilardii J11]
MVSGNGTAAAWRAMTGDAHWGKPLTGISARFAARKVAVEGVTRKFLRFF